MCARACVRACVRARVRACVCVSDDRSINHPIERRNVKRREEKRKRQERETRDERARDESILLFFPILTVRLPYARRVRAERDRRDASLIEREPFLALITHLRGNACVKPEVRAAGDEGGEEEGEQETRR